MCSSDLSMTFWRVKFGPAARRPSTSIAALIQPYVVYSLGVSPCFSIHVRYLSRPLGRGVVSKGTNGARTIDGEDFFKMLGVDRTANDEQIQSAYFGLAKTWHPDRLPSELAEVKPNATKVFARISQAYDTLSDPHRRTRYIETLGLTDYDASVLVAEPRAASLFESARDALSGLDPKLLANWVTGEYLRAANDGAGDPDPKEFAALVDAVARREISGTTAKKRAAAEDEGDGDGGDAAPGKPREVQVDWSAAELVAAGSEGDWKVDVGPAPEGLAKPRTTAIPGKSNFFEGVVPLAVSGDGTKVAVGYLLGEPKPDGTCRVVIADLEKGKATPVAVTTGQVAPFALHDDGQHLLARREEFGFGNHDRLEVWKVAGGKVRKLSSFVPYPQAGGAARDIGWARFLDGDSFATAGNGELALWRFPEIEPVGRVPMAGVPALSPDRRSIAFCDSGALNILDVASREVVARRAVPAGLFNPQLAFKIGRAHV